MKRTRVSVDIDRVVIDGLPLEAGRAAFIGHITAQELEHLLQSGPGVASDRIVGRVVAPPLTLSDGAPDETAIARGVAQRIAASLKEPHDAV